MAEFGRQLSALLWKNYLLKIRNPVSTVLELSLPASVMLMLMLVQTRIDHTTHDTAAYVNNGSYVRVGASTISPPFANIVSSCRTSGKKLAVVPNSTFVHSMISILNFKFPGLKAVTVMFPDEAALEAYVAAREYGLASANSSLIRGALVFHQEGPLVFDYSIRLNHSWAPSGHPDLNSIMDTTGDYVNDLQMGVDLIHTAEYGLSGFLSLQQAVDGFIIFNAQRKKAAGDNTLRGSYDDSNDASWHTLLDEDGAAERHGAAANGLYKNVPERVALVPFPVAEYTDDQFQVLLKNVMGILYVVAFLFPVARLIRTSVLEKESHIKEGMKMMGLSTPAYHLAFFITYAIQFSLSSAIITVLTAWSLFRYSEKSVVFVFFFLFGLSSVALCYLVAPFFSRAKTAAAVGTLAFLGAYFPYYTVVDSDVSPFVRHLASLLSPTAFALGTVNFADYERAHVGVRWSNITTRSSSVSFLSCMLFMILDSVLYVALGAYLEQVLPQDLGVQKPWYLFASVRTWACVPTRASRWLWFKFRGKGSTDLEEGLLLNGAKNEAEQPLPRRQLAAFPGKGEGEESEQQGLEPLGSELLSQEMRNMCLQIRGLRKVFKDFEGKERAAVNSLDLTLYKGQITALLGHNGAGKSTTIAMLTGLLPPTSGDAIVMGKNIRTQMAAIRRTLGVCPQHDTLYAELTVQEHMEMFAVLKGVPKEHLKSQVARMIREVGLADKAHVTTQALSGGMKRKLSVGIALIGDSKVVILDEPTSGMDPYSMRSTWRLLKRYRRDRVVLLTTHSMDEADVLADRIAILAGGKLRCCGSSLYLKLRYGVGYTLTLVKDDPAQTSVDTVFACVQRHVPGATLLSHNGAEISFRLPLASTGAFQSLFQELDKQINSDRTSREASTSSGGVMPPDTKSGNGSGSEVDADVASSSGETILDKASGASDQRLTSGEPAGEGEGKGHSVDPKSSEEERGLSISSYGVSVTTLEEVFLRVSRGNMREDSTTPNFSDGEGRGDPLQLPPGSSNSSLKDGFAPGKAAAQGSEVQTGANDFAAQAGGSPLVALSSMKVMFWSQLAALIWKRALLAARDRKAQVFQLGIPVLFLLGGLILLAVKPHPNQPSVLLTVRKFNPQFLGSGGGGAPVPFDLTLPIAQQVAAQLPEEWVQEETDTSFRFPYEEAAMADAVEVAGPQEGPALMAMSRFLIASRNASYQSRYGAVVFAPPKADGSLAYTVLHNSTCQHAGPTYINLVNDAILKMALNNPNVTIRTRNHPLPQTSSQRTQRADINAFSAAIIMNVAWAFIPASFALSVVKEREVKAKHQQLVSGVSILGYWVSTYIWDCLSYLLPAAVAMALFFLFDIQEFIGWEARTATTLLMIGYGPAAAGLTYCLTFFFNDHTMAQNVILLVHFFSGLILMVISFLMSYIPATTSIDNTLKNVYRLSPGFCLADGLAQLSLRAQSSKSESATRPFSWGVATASITYLFAEAVVYFGLVLLGEYVPAIQRLLLKLTRIRRPWSRPLHSKVVPPPSPGRAVLSPLASFEVAGSDLAASLLESVASAAGTPGLDEDEDEDVAAERRRVLSPEGRSSLVRLVNLCKVYGGGTSRAAKVAVESLSFGVEAGQCFGFLGVNGAGKTTTLSMLSGETLPTAGTAYIVGNDIRASQHAARRLVGYCPQFDALLDLLTPREHLELYACIKGVPRVHVKDAVNAKLAEMDLLACAGQTAGTLSGGNRRKLSVAVAMIGNPPLVFLDEPSTGMDPVARRFMWDLVAGLSCRQGRCAVLLTTHSMAEAQALCTRIAIMVGGRLRCIGSPQHLKSRFGNALELEVKAVTPSVSKVERLCETLHLSIPTLLRFNPNPSFHSQQGRQLEPYSSDSDSSSISSVPSVPGAPHGSKSAAHSHRTQDGCQTVIPVEAVVAAAHVLGDEQRAHALLASAELTSQQAVTGGEAQLGEAVAEQLQREGWVLARTFCEWWLAHEQALRIGAFVRASFPGSLLLERNGSIFHYQLPQQGGASLAEIFGHLERYRGEVGIAEYSMGQTTLEAIFNDFAARQQE